MRDVTCTAGNPNGDDAWVVLQHYEGLALDCRVLLENGEGAIFAAAYGAMRYVCQEKVDKAQARASCAALEELGKWLKCHWEGADRGHYVNYLSSGHLGRCMEHNTAPGLGAFSGEPVETHNASLKGSLRNHTTRGAGSQGRTGVAQKRDNGVPRVA